MWKLYFKNLQFIGSDIASYNKLVHSLSLMKYTCASFWGQEVRLRHPQFIQRLSALKASHQWTSQQRMWKYLKISSKNILRIVYHFSTPTSANLLPSQQVWKKLQKKNCGISLFHTSSAVSQWTVQIFCSDSFKSHWKLHCSAKK